MKSLTPDEKKYVRALMKKRICTIPFLVLAAFAFLFFSYQFFAYIRGQWLWHKTEATITMEVGTEFNEGYLCRYLCEGNQQYYSGSFRQPRVLFIIPYKGMSQTGDSVAIAYHIQKPYRVVTFKVLECRMINCAIFCTLFLLLYLIIDDHLRKTLPVRLT